MSLHEMLNLFFDTNLSESTKRRNIDTGSVWFSFSDLTKINFRITGGYNVIRLHMNDESTSTRITYQSETDRFRYTSVDKSNTTYVSLIIIENFSTYKSEEHFFQTSLIENFGDLEFSDIENLMNLFHCTQTIAKELLGK